MRTSTANRSESNAANLAQHSLYDPLIFELTDLGVLSFHIGDAPSTFTSTAAAGNACALDQSNEFKGWRLTLHATPSETASSDLTGVDADEDRLRLLQLQKSYQAAAQFLQVAQTKLDTLVQTMRADNEDRS